MPYVNIRVVGSLTRKQKSKMAEEVDDILERITHKPKPYTHVVLDELQDENWAMAGKLLD
jgi:4-oxalocrotonate tautomerase